MPRYVYAIGIGSNRTSGQKRRPVALVREAVDRLGALGRVTAKAPIADTAAVGPGGRRFANGAILLASSLEPPPLLAALKAIERGMGRRRGRRWGARTIDLDILLWSGGVWRGQRNTLLIPHPALAGRHFVLLPLMTIAPGWRLPGSRLSVRHLAVRLTRRRPLHRSPIRSGP